MLEEGMVVREIDFAVDPDVLRLGLDAREL